MNPSPVLIPTAGASTSNACAASLDGTDATLMREAIAARCQVGSWYALRPLLVRIRAPHLAEAGPELLADLLADADARSRAQADRLQRLLSQRQWRASVTHGAGLRQSLIVHCGAMRATLHLLVRPQLHIETIGR
jgi:hypothetical protein